MSFDGMDKLIQKLNSIPANAAKKAVRQALRPAAKVLQQEAKANAKKGEDVTGELAGSIKVRAAARSRKFIGVDVIVEAKDAEHASFIEYGTKHIKPRGYMRRSFDEKSDEAAKVALDKMKQILEDQ